MQRKKVTVASPPGMTMSPGERRPTRLGPGEAHRSPLRTVAASLAALGVVYGDLGTSPLYALRESFLGQNPVSPDPANVLGVLSLVFWALMLVVSVKYLLYVMQLDNSGEGGILALASLVIPSAGRRRSSAWVLTAMGLFGAALLYGDGMITPAISVLSAMEGLNVATSALAPFVLPAATLILILLFLVQRTGTGRIGRVFGPVLLVWFLVMALLGARAIVGNPRVLAAVNPAYAVAFMVSNGWHGFFVLGAVVLVLTGAEALYADMGHFGKEPIRLAWFAVVLPCLLLNYFGQGAQMLADPHGATHPFFHLAPRWALYPLVGLATLATVIASQAVISGAFSLTRQAILLGYLPPMRIVQTSDEEMGQVYVPVVNWTLMCATVGLVLGFRTSSNLAGAYGVAVTATMVITTLLAFVAVRERRRWSLWTAGALTLVFLVLDLSFFSANALKIVEGGWFPLAVAAAVFTLMSTWKKGRDIVYDRLGRQLPSMEEFLRSLRKQPPRRVKGTAVFLTRHASTAPPLLVHHVRHNKVLHDRVILLTLEARPVPRVLNGEMLEITRLDLGFYHLHVRHGYLQATNIPECLTRCPELGTQIDPEDTTYYVQQRTFLLGKGRSRMAHWRARLFTLMARNAATPVGLLHIPPDQVVVMGMETPL